MSKLRVLTLPIYREWFIQILNRVKFEEYRSIGPFYQTRLFTPDLKPIIFDHIKFVNGYGHQRPAFITTHITTDIGIGNPEWGAPVSTQVFRIKIGDIISTSNVNPSMYLK